MKMNRSMEYGVWSMRRISMLFILTSYFLLLTSSLAFAQTPPMPKPTTTETKPSSPPTDYTMLAPIPELAKPDDATKTNAVVYIAGLFRLIIGLAGVLAVVMLIYAGIKYMSTDAFSGKDEAKGIIENALWGLGLVIASWLILYTINPKLVEINFNIEPQEIRATPSPGGGGGTGTPPTPPPGSCSTCVVLKVPFKSPGACSGNGVCRIDSALNDRLVALKNNKFSDLFVTEAFPPTTKHQSGCHLAGTCVDVRAVGDNRVYEVIAASTDHRLRAVFEVETQSRKDTIINSSCGSSNQICRTVLADRIAVLPPKKQPDGSTKRQITAEHFSIYKE